MCDELIVVAVLVFLAFAIDLVEVVFTDIVEATFTGVEDVFGAAGAPQVAWAAVA